MDFSFDQGVWPQKSGVERREVNPTDHFTTTLASFAQGISTSDLTELSLEHLLAIESTTEVVFGEEAEEVVDRTGGAAFQVDKALILSFVSS